MFRVGQFSLSIFNAKVRRSNSCCSLGFINDLIVSFGTGIENDVDMTMVSFILIMCMSMCMKKIILRKLFILSFRKNLKIKSKDIMICYLQYYKAMSNMMRSFCHGI